MRRKKSSENLRELTEININLKIITDDLKILPCHFMKK